MKIIKAQNDLPAEKRTSQAYQILLADEFESNVILYLAIQSNITPESALNSPQISQMNKENPFDLIKAIRTALLTVNSLFNFPEDKKLSQRQIDYLTLHLKKEYWRFKFDEFIYVLGQGASGKFGKAYSRLDVEVISDWFRIYDEKIFWQQRELSGYNQNAYSKRFEKEKPIEIQPMPEHIKKKFNDLKEKLIKGTEEKPEQKETIEEKIEKHKQRTDEELNKLLPSLKMPEIKEILNQLILDGNERQANLIRDYISNLLYDIL